MTQIWASLGELGWLDLEDFLDEAVLFEEAGRALLPVPYLPTVAFARPALVSEQPVTLAWAEDASPLLTSTQWATTADASGRLTGVKRLVPDLALAERVVVVAADGLYAVDVSAAEVTAAVDGRPAAPARRPHAGRDARRARRRPGPAAADPAPGLRGARVARRSASPRPRSISRRRMRKPASSSAGSSAPTRR